MKTLTKGLIVTILLSISIFFGITYVNTYLRTGESTISEQNNSNLNNDDEELSPVEDPVINPFYSSLPRAATELSNNEKINNIGGYSKDTLKNYFLIGNTLYIIFETDSVCCDARAKATNIAIAKLTATGSVENVLTLENTSNEYYVTSSLYDNGIMIVARRASETVVYTVTTALAVSRLVLPYVFDNCLLRYSYPLNILITALDNTATAFGINANLTLAFTVSGVFTGSISPLEMFTLDANYLFANIGGKGMVVKFNSSGVINTMELSSSAISEIIPTQDGYLASVIKNGRGYLKWYDRDFSEYAETELSECENIRISFNGCGYFALAYGAAGEGKSFFVCRNGDIVSRNYTDFSNIKQVTCIEVYQSCLYISALTHAANNTIEIFEYDGNHFYASTRSTVVGVATTRVFGFTRSDTLYTLYTTALSTGHHISSWGNEDVFIRVKSL